MWYVKRLWLKVGRRPEHFRPRQGGIHCNPVSGNYPCRQLPTGTVTLKPDRWKNTQLTPMLTKRVWNLWREGRAGNLSLQRFTQTQAKCHVSKGEEPSPWDHPTWCHMRFWGNLQLLTPVRHKPATSIGLILTLPKLHLATYNSQAFQCCFLSIQHINAVYVLYVFYVFIN